MNYPAVAMTAFGLTGLMAASSSSKGAAIVQPFGNARTVVEEPGQMAAPKSPAAATLEEQIASAEKGVARERLWFYRGFVEDSSGKRMRGVKIDIFRSGSGGKAPVASTQSDSHGHFVTHLTNGEYTAVMQAKGFSPLIYIFEITYEGVEKELRFRLNQAPKT
jgi:protocatechuate 3,4-dioxygenase beta subunit